MTCGDLRYLGKPKSTGKYMPEEYLSHLSVDPLPILRTLVKISFQLAELCTAEGYLSIPQFRHLF